MTTLTPISTLYIYPLTVGEMNILSSSSRQVALDRVLHRVSYSEEEGVNVHLRLVEVCRTKTHAGRAHVEVRSSADTEETRQEILDAIQRFIHDKRGPAS